MKQRNGHVTNSSSSSFIIAYKDSFGTVDKKTLEKYPYLDSVMVLINKSLFDEGKYDTTEAIVFESPEDWEDYWVEENKYYVYTYGISYPDDKICAKDILDVFEKVENEKGWSFTSEKELYYKPLEHLNNGFKVMIKKVDYADDWLSSMIEKLDNPKNFVVISGRR